MEIQRMRWVTTRKETKKDRAGRQDFTAAQLVLNGNLLSDVGIESGDLVDVAPVRRGEIRVKRVPPSDPRYPAELAKRRAREQRRKRATPKAV